MPLFAPPLPQTYNLPPPNPHLPSLPIRKRKHSASPSDSDDEKFLSIDKNADNRSSLPAASTNPLSLTPDEIVQYRLAGLELDEELPGKKVRGWPHRGLGPLGLGEAGGRRKKDKGKGKGKERSGDRESVGEDDNRDAEREEKGSQRTGRPWLRMQHFGVLTAILQRCLLEGDIERASRAWALLIRVQIDGKGIDIRSSGYWGIGAELLVRGMERQGPERWARETEESNSDSEENERVEGGHENVDEERRWGTAEGLDKAKEYYERLILQHPYKRQFEHSISALDFWPAMLGCEIYGIQSMQKEGLKRIAALETKDDDEENESGSEYEREALNQDDEETRDITLARQELRRRRRKAEKIWKGKEEIRQTALIATEKIAGRMEQLMTTPPYSDSHVLLRLRGMIALYIGDLNVPEAPINEDGDGDGDAEPFHGNKDREYRFLMRQREADYRRGKLKQEEERNRARTLFRRIKKGGGDVSDMERLLLENEDEGNLYDAN